MTPSAAADAASHTRTNDANTIGARLSTHRQVPVYGRTAGTVTTRFGGPPGCAHGTSDTWDIVGTTWVLPARIKAPRRLPVPLAANAPRACGRTPGQASPARGRAPPSAGRGHWPIRGIPGTCRTWIRNSCVGQRYRSAASGTHACACGSCAQEACSHVCAGQQDFERGRRGRRTLCSPAKCPSGVRAVSHTRRHHPTGGPRRGLHDRPDHQQPYGPCSEHRLRARRRSSSDAAMAAAFSSSAPGLPEPLCTSPTPRRRPTHLPAAHGSQVLNGRYFSP
ncbi:hypothetical protein H4W34_000193 [Actinomadura algeriensis]|uniref:Uncharacterized protein n=1 Tax=Actinomadura algeriensis TaxID=1679523 RepID=A0ABR9JIH9_9ACTN|nr:hypothetical protein [Actinomadura algeriensis]